MAARKKVFSCGHVGFGRFCHCCARIEAERSRREAERIARRAARIKPEVPIDLDHLHPEVADRVSHVIDRLRGGDAWFEMNGKRLNYDRSVISIPIGQHYRLVCTEVQGGNVIPVRALSHNDYNHLQKGM